MILKVGPGFLNALFMMPCTLNYVEVDKLVLIILLLLLFRLPDLVIFKK